MDQLLAGWIRRLWFEHGGLLDELKNRLAEGMLNAEMEHHLGSASLTSYHDVMIQGKNLDCSLLTIDAYHKGG